MHGARWSTAAEVRFHLDGMGNSVYSRKPLRKGQLLACQRPYVCVVADNVHACVCAHCLISCLPPSELHNDSFLACPRCWGKAQIVPHYCSESCLKADLAMHTAECFILRLLSENIPHKITDVFGPGSSSFHSTPFESTWVADTSMLRCVMRVLIKRFYLSSTCDPVPRATGAFSVFEPRPPKDHHPPVSRIASALPRWVCDRAEAVEIPRLCETDGTVSLDGSMRFDYEEQVAPLAAHMAVPIVSSFACAEGGTTPPPPDTEADAHDRHHRRSRVSHRSVTACCSAAPTGDSSARYLEDTSEGTSVSADGECEREDSDACSDDEAVARLDAQMVAAALVAATSLVVYQLANWATGGTHGRDMNASPEDVAADTMTDDATARCAAAIGTFWARLGVGPVSNLVERGARGDPGPVLSRFAVFVVNMLVPALLHCRESLAVEVGDAEAIFEAASFLFVQVCNGRALTGFLTNLSGAAGGDAGRGGGVVGVRHLRAACRERAPRR